MNIFSKIIKDCIDFEKALIKFKPFKFSRKPDFPGSLAEELSIISPLSPDDIQLNVIDYLKVFHGTDDENSEILRNDSKKAVIIATEKCISLFEATNEVINPEFVK